MSNKDTTKISATGVEISTERFDTATQPFTVESLKLGQAEMSAFTVDGRENKQHMRLNMSGVVINSVRQFTASTGETQVGISLTVGGLNTEIAMWGTTLDALASAIDTARLTSWGQ